MNKSKRRLIALISAFSILINSISFWSPLLVLAQETPEPTPVVEMTPEPTVEPTSDAQTNYNTPIPEVTIVPSPSDSFQKEDQLNQTPIPGPSPLADYEPLPSATPFAGLANEPVEKVCLSQGEEIKDTVNEDWEINFEEGWAKTKEPVKLGIKYLFPQENKVSVTFKCLPKEGTTQLKIQKVKVSDLKLPEGVNPYGGYAYDITTGMKDGSFEYDMTLPKPEDKSAKVSYMEQPNGEVKEIEEGKVNQEGDKVKVEGIDHFTIYFVESNYITIKVEPVSYLQGETVYLKADGLNSSKYYQFYLDPPGGGGGGGEFSIGSCQSGSATTITESYTLSTSAAIGEWKVELYRFDNSGCSSGKHSEGEKRFTVNQPKADLVVSKTNNVGGITKIGQVFKWTLRVTNQGTARADFGKNETILIDNLPDSGVTYSSPVVENVTNVSQVGGINCSISAAKDLICKTGNANGNYVYIEVGGYFDVSIDVTPSASTLLENPRGGRGGDTCQVDPDNKVPESQDNNNNCSDSVFVTLADGNCNICANGGKPGWLVLRLETTSGVIKVKAGNGPGDPVIFNQSVNQGSTFTINGDKADGTFSKNDLYFYKDDNLVGKIHVSCSKDIISGQTTDETHGNVNGVVDFTIIEAHNKDSNLTCPISTPTPTPTPTPAPYCGDGVKNGNEECDGTAGIPQGAENEIRCNNRCQFELIEPKVDICHATNSNQNPYVENQPNKSGDVSGHDGHNGSIWYPGINTSWGDIIPPFWYLDDSNNPKQYTGKNWDSQGKAFWKNNCNIPASTVTLCKKDQNQRPLSGWRLYLLGDKVGNTINVASDGSIVNAGSYSNDNYVLLASGTYNYGDSRMIADAANSYRYVGLSCAGPTDGWVNGEASSCMNNYLSLNFSTSGGPTAPGWGTYYNPQHKYAKAFTGGNLNLKIWDTCNLNQLEGCYSDNEGSLQLDIYKGYVGDTDQNGCITFNDVPYGQYQVGEILQDGWQEASGSGTVVIDSSEETFTVVNNELPKLGNLEVTKVVDWKNANYDTSKNFEICITGPSYPSGNCKNSDYDGQTLSWNNIQIGDYTITETNPGNNWIVTGSSQTVTVNKDQTTKAQVKNEINPIIIKGYKVVCDSEQYLPNWGSHGATIGATTAQNFVNNSQGHCRLEDGWKFQYAKAGSGSFGGFQTNTSELGAPWVTFGPTVSGEATAIISDVSSFGGRIEVREVFKDNTYFPFSNAGNVSAEFYCTGDVYNYDNWEWINNPQYGQTYYCVAFNARKNTEITGKKFNDLNRNGVNDSEPGLGDWKILAAQKVDEINVAAKDMPTVTSNITLASGQKYLLRVSGTFGAGDNITADAKYSVRSPNTFWTDYVQNYESYGPTLLDLQINNASPNWGSYNPNHVYWLTYTGGGSPINFRIYDIYPPNNSGNLNVKIYKVLSETTTGSDGNYTLTLTGELGEDVIVAEETQDGWMQTAPTGYDFGYCNVNAYQTNTCNFGNAVAYGSISGYKYEDINGNGSRDKNENNLLPGWTIALKQDNNEIDSTTTGNGGTYSFTNVIPGDYQVCEVLSKGWIATDPEEGNCKNVTVDPGKDVQVNFGNLKVVLGLSLTKSNSAVSALSSGSEAPYTLVIKNTGNQRLTGVTIKDAPSGGFSYVNGSGLLEGNPITPTVLSGYLEWYIGTLEASGDEGDTKTLTYKMKSDSSLPSGVYPNIAIATGVYIPYEHEGNEEVVGIFEPVEVLAVSEDTESGERVESNAGTPVNSQVELKQVLAYSTGVGVVGQVLGAATEAGQVLPAAGSDTRFFVFAIAALIFGLFLKFGSFALNKNWIDYRRLKKGLKNIFASILFLLVFSLFAPFAKAFSDYVSITKLSSYINKEDFKISYSALSENPISAQFYVRKDGDSSWRTLGSALTGASGYVQVSGGDIYNGDGKYFFKVVINGGTAEDETSTIVDRQAPDAVRDYRKEKLGDGHYKLYWRNPDNEDFDKVIIYRSDSTNFTADSSTEVATIWGSKDTEMTSENAAAPGKEYYFAIRAIDKAGNASSVVSDPETQVSAGSVLGASVSATSTPEVVKILPKEKATGEVLGEEKTEDTTPLPTLTPQEEKGGVLGQAVKFAKDRTKLTVGIIAVLLFAGYLGLRKFRSGGKK